MIANRQKEYVSSHERMKITTQCPNVMKDILCVANLYFKLHGRQPAVPPTQAPAPKSVGFGESAFLQPSAGTSQGLAQPKKSGGEVLGMGDKGKSISFKDSYLKGD